MLDFNSGSTPGSSWPYVEVYLGKDTAAALQTRGSFKYIIIIIIIIVNTYCFVYR